MNNSIIASRFPSQKPLSQLPVSFNLLRGTAFFFNSIRGYSEASLKENPLINNIANQFTVPVILGVQEYFLGGFCQPAFLMAGADMEQLRRTFTL